MGEGLEEERVIVGLGNPGKKYEMTRHNMGFIVLHALAQEQGWTFKEEKRFHALVAQGKIGQVNLHLLLPTTYMNESGRALRAYVDFYKYRPSHLLVVSDDVELEFGTMRMRPTGGSGGHNGLKSIEAHLSTKHYARLRLGIGRGQGAEPLVEHVLDPFSQEELAQLPTLVKRAVEGIKLIIAVDPAQAMQSINAKVK